jgi:hypothetical protein
MLIFLVFLSPAGREIDKEIDKEEVCQLVLDIAQDILVYIYRERERCYKSSSAIN